MVRTPYVTDQAWYLIQLIAGSKLCLKAAAAFWIDASTRLEWKSHCMIQAKSSFQPNFEPMSLPWKALFSVIAGRFCTQEIKEALKKLDCFYFQSKAAGTPLIVVVMHQILHWAAVVCAGSKGCSWFWADAPTRPEWQDHSWPLLHPRSETGFEGADAVAFLVMTCRDAIETTKQMLQKCIKSCFELPLCAQAAKDATNFKLVHPHDRNGKTIADRYCTREVEEALKDYRQACDTARGAVRNQLRQLAEKLEVCFVCFSASWPAPYYVFHKKILYASEFLTQPWMSQIASRWSCQFVEIMSALTAHVCVPRLVKTWSFISFIHSFIHSFIDVLGRLGRPS